jgi:hypothetical protein
MGYVANEYQVPVQLRELKNRFPEARVRVIDGQGHLVDMLV